MSGDVGRGPRVLVHRLKTQSRPGRRGERAGPDLRQRFGFAVADRREALPVASRTADPGGTWFGFVVKDRRESPGLTREEFAERAGLHRTYLSDIERGTRNVSLINIERVAAALELMLSGSFHPVEQA